MLAAQAFQRDFRVDDSKRGTTLGTLIAPLLWQYIGVSHSGMGFPERPKTVGSRGTEQRTTGKGAHLCRPVWSAEMGAFFVARTNNSDFNNG